MSKVTRLCRSCKNLSPDDPNWCLKHEESIPIERTCVHHRFD